MKKIILPILCLTMMATMTSCNKGKIVINDDKTPELKNTTDSLSWVMGFSMAQSMASTGIELNREVFYQAIEATLNSKQQPFSEQQTYDLLNRAEMMAYMNQQTKAEENRVKTMTEESGYFEQLLRDNKNVKRTASGLCYEVLQQGSGENSKDGQIVVFDYKGIFTNGQVFDQTYGNRESITHLVSESIMPGLHEGLKMMNKGSKYRFYIPSSLGFGATGTDVIPPNTIIIYEVELHDIHD